MSPARKRLALLFVVVGSALVLERVVAFASGEEGAATPSATTAAAPREPDERRVASTGADALTDARGSEGRTVDKSRPDTPPAGTLVLHLDKLDAAQRPGEAIGHLFEARRVQPAPPPVALVVAAAPPPPTAPAFPYSYFGGMTDGDQRIGFFQRGDRVVTVRAGDTVDGNFRIDQINASHMTYTYLPLATPATLALGVAR
jgi:hypothetical protein